MTIAIADAELPTIGVFSPEFQADPYPTYGVLRGRHWIAQCEMGFIVLGHRAMVDLLKDRRLIVPVEQLLAMLGVTEGPYHDWWVNHIQSLDFDRHARTRRLILPAFQPKSAEAGRDLMRETFTELLEPHLAGGQMEAVTALGDYSVRVLCRLIGADDSDVPRFAGWLDTLSQGYHMRPDLIPEFDKAMVNLWEYVSAIVLERMRSRVGRDDLMQAIVDAQEGGDRLSQDEVISLVIFLLEAGNDTTKYQLANLLHSFATHPDQWDRLVAEPALIPSAVDEGLRFRPAAATTARIAREEIEYDGLRIPEGSLLLMAIAAANRDPAVFTDPDVFDIARREDAHLTFVWGRHFCAGSHIAKAELAVALEILTQRIGRPQLTEAVTWRPPLGAWGPDRLHLTFDLPPRKGNG